MSNLSDFTKEIIRECAKQPKTNLYSVYAEVMHYCPKSGYSIEQVGKYLRYVKRGILRSKVYAAVKEPTHNLRDVTNSLTNQKNPLSKTALTTTKCEELVMISGGVF